MMLRSMLVQRRAMAPPMQRECAVMSDGWKLTKGPMTVVARHRALVMSHKRMPWHWPWS